MNDESSETVRGSGNVFRDLEHKNADAEQFKAILAAEIIKALDREGLSVRAAHGRTGIAAADFSRIRNADLGRFTVDRLMSIINRLGSRVDNRPRSLSTISYEIIKGNRRRARTGNPKNQDKFSIPNSGPGLLRRVLTGYASAQSNPPTAIQ